jgi:hypothetical protein
MAARFSSVTPHMRVGPSPFQTPSQVRSRSAQCCPTAAQERCRRLRTPRPWQSFSAMRHPLRCLVRLRGRLLCGISVPSRSRRRAVRRACTHRPTRTTAKSFSRRGRTLERSGGRRRTRTWFSLCRSSNFSICSSVWGEPSMKARPTTTIQSAGPGPVKCRGLAWE